MIIESVTKLLQKRHNLIIMLDKKEISQEEYDVQITQIKSEVDIENNKYLEENNMAKEIKQDVKEVKDVKKVKAPKVARENSLASIIGKALEMKGVKNMDQAVAKIQESCPNVDRKKIVSRINTTINECKKGIKRWGKYTWDEGSFSLIPKQ